MQKRMEDRRSCHNVSLVLGLAVASREFAVAELMFALLMQLVEPVRGQEAN